MFFLVGNQCDLNDDSRVVSFEKGKMMSEKLKVDFFTEASAKTGENVSEIINEVGKRLYKMNIKKILGAKRERA